MLSIKTKMFGTKTQDVSSDPKMIAIIAKYEDQLIANDITIRIAMSNTFAALLQLVTFISIGLFFTDIRTMSHSSFIVLAIATIFNLFTIKVSLEYLQLAKKERNFFALLANMITTMLILLISALL